jgi:hypothetical protein
MLELSVKRLLWIGVCMCWKWAFFCCWGGICNWGSGGTLSLLIYFVRPVGPEIHINTALLVT